MATYAAPQGDAKSMLHFNSPSMTSNFAWWSARRSAITFESTGNATGGSTWRIVSKRRKTERMKLQNEKSLLLLNEKRSKLSGAGSTTLSGSTSAAKVCGRCKSKMVLKGCWTLTLKRQCRRRFLTKSTACDTTYQRRPWFVKERFTANLDTQLPLLLPDLSWTERTNFRRRWMPPPGNCLRRLHISGAWRRRTRLTASSCKNAGNNGGRKWRRIRPRPSPAYILVIYITGTDCDYISQFHVLRVSLVLKKGIALERWSKGLSVMLEKIIGVRLVSKLRAILLMEADFNAMNKDVYGVRMLDNVRWYKLILEELFSEQNRTAGDGGLAKMLFYDIAHQTRTPAAIASVDASNCYDRIAHAMASLIF